MSATIAIFPRPTLSYECLKPSLDRKVTKDIDSTIWAQGGPNGLTPKDDYANQLRADALRGIEPRDLRRFARAGLKTVADVAYAPRETLVALGSNAGQRAALGRLSDALKVCTGDVYIQ
jgi:hypothetical protein